MAEPRLLTSIELRYVLMYHLTTHGRSTVRELVAALDFWGFAVRTRPSKAVSDAFRTDVIRGRVNPRARGVYESGYTPNGTEHRIRKRVLALREEARPFREERLARSDRCVQNMTTPAPRGHTNHIRHLLSQQRGAVGTALPASD